MSIIWSICILVSFFGWGSLTLRVLAVDRGQFGPASTSIIGMASILFLGSIHQLLRLPTIPYFFILVLVGSAFCLLEGVNFRGFSRSIWSDRVVVGLGVLVFISLLFRCLLPFFENSLNCYDDFLAYITHSRMIIDNSSIVDPFGFRRLASFGGQSYLQAIFLIFGDENLIEILDKSIALLLVAGMILEFFSHHRNGKIFGLLLVVFFVWASHPRLNSAAQLTGTAFALTFIILLERIFSGKLSKSIQTGFLLALVGTAFATLRANYFLGVGLMMLPLIFSKERKWGLTAIAMLFGLLLPWCFLLVQSSNTPFFPLFKGNYNWSIETLSYRPPFSDIISLTITVLWESWFFTVTALSSLAFYFTRNKFVWIVYLAYLSEILVTHFFSMSANDVAHAIRYSYPFMVASLFYSSRLAFGHSKIRALQVVVLLVTLSCFPDAFVNMGSAKSTILSARVYADSKENTFGPAREVYQQIQNGVSEGARIVAAVDKPFLFNFKRNSILPLDVPGQASPPPGISFEDSQKTINYLKNMNVDVFIYQDPQKSLCQYNETFWENINADKVPAFFRNWLPLHKAYFGFIKDIKPQSESIADGFYLFRIHK